MPDCVFRVRTVAERTREVAGWDSSLAQMRPELYTQIDGARTVNVRALGAYLRRCSEFGARSAGEVLHHAEWFITADPEQVRAVGFHPDHPGCPACTAGVDQALAFLAADPGHELLAGKLFWAGRAPNRSGAGEDS